MSYDTFSHRDQWFKNCQLDNGETDKLLYLCELHFEEMSFTSSKELKPDAVPTIFDKTEGMCRIDKNFLSTTFIPSSTINFYFRRPEKT